MLTKGFFNFFVKFTVILVKKSIYIYFFFIKKWKVSHSKLIAFNLFKASKNKGPQTFSAL